MLFAINVLVAWRLREEIMWRFIITCCWCLGWACGKIWFVNKVNPRNRTFGSNVKSFYIKNMSDNVIKNDVGVY